MCAFAKQMIVARSREVLLDCNALNAGLFRASPELHVARLVRRQIGAIDRFMADTCGRSDRYLSNLR